MWPDISPASGELISLILFLILECPVLPISTFKPKDIILFFKDLKANIQEGYAYSVIDNVSVTNVKDDTYLLCADYSRFDNNDKLLFEGRTHYVYINTSDGWKINSLEPKDRSTNVPCVHQ